MKMILFIWRQFLIFRHFFTKILPKNLILIRRQFFIEKYEVFEYEKGYFYSTVVFVPKPTFSYFRCQNLQFVLLRRVPSQVRCPGMYGLLGSYGQESTPIGHFNVIFWFEEGRFSTIFTIRQGDPWWHAKSLKRREGSKFEKNGKSR